MLPSIIDTQLRNGVRDYLRTTFPVTTPLFSSLIEDLVTDQDRMFKGPYISLGLPYLQGDAGTDVIPDIPLTFPPYLHQQKAFERMRGDACKSTIVATGTGSGKTECFLLPILEHCLKKRREHENGIKAIIIYPMNALAQDQARRIAETIRRNDALKGQVTAGLYVGGKQKAPHKVMGDNHIITDRETMRLRPPDILLTNYKMLDYLLSRPFDRGVWNQNGAGTLRYLVVDELHTFDGAQGTDLACLIRRLKYRLEAHREQLCCVGTSATLGGPESMHDLREYAAKVFGEPFDEESIITESRENFRDFLHGSFIARSFDIPAEEHCNRMDPSNYSTVDEYLRQQISLWFGDAIAMNNTTTEEWKIALGNELKKQPLFRTILQILDGTIVAEDMLLRHLRGTFQEFAAGSAGYHRILLQSLIALISTARTRSTIGVEPGLVPFVQVRYQSWLRELRRMVASVGKNPRLEFAADLTDTELKLHLPVVHCRECGSTGWAGLKKQSEDKVKTTLADFYSGYFAKHPSPNICYLFPDTGNLESGKETGYYAALCPDCLRLNTPDKTSCGDCGSNALLEVFLPYNRRKDKKGLKSHHNCPVCKGRDSLILIGARSASLSSVIINQLFSSPYNDDKKLIAFSDNVQDASHRAGFYGARTWRFNFRTALQQCLDSLDHSPTIEALPDIFCDYWKKHKSIEEYVATFLPPDMSWQEDFVALLDHGKTDFSSVFITGLDKRLGWEIYAEYGYSSRMGRTLEMAGCSVGCMATSLTESMLEKLSEKFENDIGTLRGNITPKQLGQFIVGFYRRLIMRGGFYHEVLKQYVEYQGNIYYANRIPWMRDFGYGIPTPAFAATTTGHESRFEKMTSRPDKPSTWFGHWLVKHFGRESIDILNCFQDVYRAILGWCIANDLVIEHTVQNERVWVLNPAKNVVDRSVHLHRCVECGYRVAAPSSEDTFWTDMPCLKPGCNGHFEHLTSEHDYYAHLYRYGDIQRLFPREHTGLLTREEREPLETLFKAKKEEKKSWYPNLLSCTPTLEMGIDIGDLSSILLCSVPPEQAAYLQRIGRAGRTDGNSTCTTIAAGVPHDLYFYSEPEEMMQGHVKTPGVYLDASAVLERQFTSFCLDQWVWHDEDATVPPKISPILSRIAKNSAQGFPFSLFDYVNNNRDVLERTFIDLFSGMLSEETKTHIHDFIVGSEHAHSLERKILNGLHTIVDEKKYLEKQRNLLSSRIIRLKSDAGADPDEIDDLILERDAFNELINKMNAKNTFEFLTAEGLTPNYAFPESGVQLQSIIYRKSTRENGAKYFKTIYEYERAASTAIKDLVPGNTFYAHGRKVVIDQVNIALSTPEIWRLCPECTFFAIENEENATNNCPICASPMWADGQQKRKMLKVRQVMATTPSNRGLISDDADNRTVRYFRKYMFFGYKRTDIIGAWQTENEIAPFGFEVLKTARFQEINFGEPDTNGVDIHIAGKDIDATGFTICRHCGKIQPEHGDPQHTFGCTARKVGADENFTETLFLYRDFESEAVRFFIPSVMELSDRKLQSFLAALMLGLTKFYKGDITHLQTCLHDEPLEGLKVRRRFVVLFDTVPGGTGYLKELAMKPNVVFDVLQEALNRLNTCTCNQTDRDGCYGCLYAYRNSFEMEHISREAAKELLGILVKNRDTVTQIKSVSAIDVNSLLESELEHLFTHNLGEYARTRTEMTFSAVTIGTKSGYRLKIGEEIWDIEPQVETGPEQRVAVPSRVDFLFRNVKGNSLPIAVFTDGFGYHANRLDTDTAQRMALVQSGAFHVWSLSWRDVDSVTANTRTAAGAASFQLSSDVQAKFNSGCDIYKIPEMKNRCSENSMTWLLKYLEKPSAMEWTLFARVHVLFKIDPEKIKESGYTEQWFKEVTAVIPEPFSHHLTMLSEPRMVGLPALNKHVSLAISMQGGKNGTEQQCAAAIVINDDDTLSKHDWNEFLQWTNLLQFLPTGFLFSRKGVELSQYSGIKTEKPAEAPADQSDEKWKPVYNLISEPRLRQFVHEVSQLTDNIPEVGFELTDSHGKVIADSEMAWESLKIAVVWDEECCPVFSGEGWKVFLVDTLINDSTECMECITRSNYE